MFRLWFQKVYPSCRHYRTIGAREGRSIGSVRQRPAVSSSVTGPMTKLGRQSSRCSRQISPIASLQRHADHAEISTIFNLSKLQFSLFLIHSPKLSQDTLASLNSALYLGWSGCHRMSHNTCWQTLVEDRRMTMTEVTGPKLTSHLLLDINWNLFSKWWWLCEPPAPTFQWFRRPN